MSGLDAESPPLARWGGLAAVLVAGAAMALWSWGSSPHPFIDFGREAYTAWRLSEGALLYRDIAYFNGPLSPCWNALLFGLFGVGLDTLFVANGLVALAIALLLHHLLRRFASWGAATLAVGFFAVAIAFTQMEPVGNDGYLAPYSHEITHGLLLGLAALALAARPSRLAAFLAGLALGLTVLTKVEMAIAAIAGVAALWLARSRLGPHDGGAAAAWGLLGGALPPVVAFAALASALPADEALRGVLGSWLGSLDPELVGHHFYRWTRGTLAPGANLAAMLAWGVGGLALLGSASLAGARWPRAGPAATVGSALAVALPLAFAPLEWAQASRPLPLLLAGLLWLDLRRLRQASGARPEAPPGLATRIGFAVFALVLLAKIVLKVRLIQYGFVLAVPGLMLAIVSGLDALPRWLRARGRSEAFARGAVLGLLAISTLSMLQVSAFYFGSRSHPIGEGRDAFRTDARGLQLQPALDELAARMRPGDTLLVLPEGVMLNYLLRVRTPARHLNYMPPELILFGEETILEELRASPPRFVAIVHKDTSVYGVPWFGRDYGRSIAGWVHSRYRPVARYGEPPLAPGSFFGVDLLERRPGEGSGGS